MQDPLATICIINYRTPYLTQLCLRSIRKFTDKQLYRVIVIDNNSADASLDYLRSLRWIELVERHDENLVKKPAVSHATALDMGLDRCTTPFFISMHSDTFVYQPDWLNQLIDPFRNDPLMACCGGGKLDLNPKWLVLLKKYTDVKAWLRKLNPKERARMQFYVRTICAAYRVETLRELNLHFHQNFELGRTAGQDLYYELIRRNYHTCVIPEYDQASKLHHLAHATMVLNPEFSVRKHTDEKCRKKITAILNDPLTKEIMTDQSLDQ